MSHDRRPLSVLSMPALCLALGAGDVFGQAATPEHPALAENRARLDQLSADVEREFVIGPGVAGELGYRVAWQARLNGKTPLRGVRAGILGIFVLDEKNVIARLRPSDGEVLWRVAVADAVDIFRGVTFADVPVTTGHDSRGAIVTMEPRAFLSTDTECFGIDPNSGSVVSRQRFAKLPATEPLAVGPYLVYGTIGGQVVWHQCVAGFEMRANSLDSTSRSRPVRSGDTVIAASERGMVLCMDATKATTRWSTRTLGGINASPAVGDGVVYVPSDDQYLWAFDAQTGAFRWRYFTQSPLNTPPFAFGNAVLQYMPDEGLVCLESRVNGKIDGVVRWRNKEATGVPVGMIGDDILLWDASKRVLSLVDSVHGSVRQRHSLPQVDELFLATRGEFEHDIFATSKDGRVVRLTPIRAMASTRTDAPKSRPAETPLSIPATGTEAASDDDHPAAAPKSSL